MAAWICTRNIHFLERPRLLSVTFLITSIDVILKLADVPLLIGFNEAEGLHFSTRLIKEPKLAERFVESMSTCGPINLFGLEESQITENDLEASNKLISSYNAIEGGQIQMEEFTDLMGDAVYGLSTHQFSEYLRVNNYTAYRYIYSHVGGYSLADTMSSSSTQFFINMLKLLVGVFESIGLGACHGDENLSLFSHFPWISYLVNEDDYSVKDNMNRWWANFAKYGDPNGKTRRKVSRGPENEGLTWEPVSFTSGRWDYWTISITPTMEERKDLKTRFQRWL